jgi:Xaa-Pro aminopeptidase
MQKNEPILIDFGTVVNGYHMDESRMFVMGKMPPEPLAASRAAIEILDLLRHEMKPGVCLGKIYDTAVAAAHKMGLDDLFLGPANAKSRFIGHSIGLEQVEQPIMARGRATVLAPGMVFAVEPKFISTGQFAAGIESVVLITHQGCRLLSQTPQEIFYC